MVDVVVIGGGPAGSTVSTLIAQRGYRVELFERERFPRFHIGESLIPETYWVLKRLNMLPKMQQSPFVKKYSVQFVNASGKLSAPFYFWDNKPHECSQTWQVVRSEFDLLMLNNAREHGVEAHEGVRVLDVLFEAREAEAPAEPHGGDPGPRATARQEPRPPGRAVGVRIQEPDGTQREVRAKVVVDASGQSGLLQNRFKLRVWDPLLNKGAIWTYWEGAYRDTGRDEGATLVIQTPSKQGWFWYIPQHDNIVSVGVVGPFDYLFNRRGREGEAPAAREGEAPAEPQPSTRGATARQEPRPPGLRGHEQTYHEEVDACPAVKERVASAKRVTGYFATKDYSYRATQVAGAGWVLIGDAFGFLDPLYSSGVLLALRSGEMAADAIVEGFQSGDLSAAQLGKWGPAFNEGVDRMRRLVCEYYDGFSFGNFVRHYPHLKGTVTDLLIGD